MRTGILLEELINIAQISKTDFAISMNMTPSGLSKILKGGRLLFFKEKKIFSRQAAGYFSESLYSHCCYLKFERIFPVIYDFNSKYELELFLSYAIEYAIDKDLEEENNGNLIYPDSESSFLGQKNILNIFCVLISDYLTAENDIPFEFCSTLPLLNRFYFDIFNRIKLVPSAVHNSINFNHFLDFSSIKDSSSKYNMSFLSSIVKAQNYIDLNLWKITQEIDCSFLLLKGKFLLVFNLQLDGTPLMTYITQKSHVASFLNSLLQKEAKKISYNGKDGEAALEANPSLSAQLMNGNIDAVYNFIPIGYLVEEPELEVEKSREHVKKNILQTFHSIITKESVFFITINAMMNFCRTGNVIVPFIGKVNIPTEKRISYLHRFDSLIFGKNTDKIKIINNELPEMTVLCAPGLSLVYMIDHDYKSEKIHYFETDFINEILSREVTEKRMNVLEFTQDIWNNYLEEMSDSLLENAL